MTSSDETEIILTEEELVEIVQKHYAESHLKHHFKYSHTRGMITYSEKDDVYKFMFTSRERD